jgi:penicillin-binding protein 1A
MDAIRRDLEIILEKEDIELGGLEITTTIDLRIQHKAEEALNQRLTEVERTSGYAHPTRAAWDRIPVEQRDEPKYIQGAAVVIENRTGAVMAVVGGRDAMESRFNRAKDARRQIGSVFKPFVYLAAFDKGMQPDTPISDGPLEPGEITSGSGWHPDNSDGKFGGIEPASYGLIHSRNTMSARVGNFATMPIVKQVAKSAGFLTPVPDTPASYLGTWEASPWEVTTAYSMFPNEGERYRPYLISEIKDRDGNVLYTTLPLHYQAATGASSTAISKILQQVTEEGTAASVRRLGFDKPCGGKTGTTNDFKDAWFAGYTSQLTCAVWCGLDQPQKTIYGGYGAVLALPVWVEIMKTADRLGYKAGRLHDNTHKVSVQLCRLSSKRATTGCDYAATSYTAWVPVDDAPATNDMCPIHPARAVAVGTTGSTKTPPRAVPVKEAPPRAVPVQEN